ncbi:ABC transporter ATP-binding protein [Stappia sp.]|uniref:ABC transporter ATP-binding protein n=1 Tax=Stappia sp. TaxID=1870903 RepID=UPI003A99C0B0
MSERTNDAILEVRDLQMHFRLRSGLFGSSTRTVKAVDKVDLEIRREQTLSLVGESGCGKTTVGRCIIGLQKISGGEIRLDGQRIDDLGAAQLHPYRRRMGMVFQDPFSSLNPRQRVSELVAEPIRSLKLLPAGKIAGRVEELLGLVGLPAGSSRRWPHEFSGGQRQRICIARALAGEPDLLICDESVSALDVSVQAQIINLLCDLQTRLGLAILFISHDLAVVEHLSHQVAVMYLGRIVEKGPRDRVFSRPGHPYTQALLSAAPVPDPAASDRRIILQGDVPSPTAPPPGCRFSTRCPHAFDRCHVEEPAMTALEEGAAACHLLENESTA